MNFNFIIITNHDIVVYLGYDYKMCFMYTLEGKIIKDNKIHQKNELQFKVWFVKRVHGMRIRFGNHSMEHRCAIVSIINPSNMEIGLFWCQEIITNEHTILLIFQW